MARGVNTKANGIDFRANRFDEFLKLIPQNLTDAEKAQVMANLGITPTPGSLDGAVRYDAAQTLTDGQKETARKNIGASINKPVIPGITPEYAPYIKEIYIANLPAGDVSLKCYGSSAKRVYIHAADRADIHGWYDVPPTENNVPYPLKVYQNDNDDPLYPIGTILGYVVFSDVESFKSISTTSLPRNVNRAYCENIYNSPIIADFLKLQPLQDDIEGLQDDMVSLIGKDAVQNEEIVNETSSYSTKTLSVPMSVGTIISSAVCDNPDAGDPRIIFLNSDNEIFFDHRISELPLELNEEAVYFRSNKTGVFTINTTIPKIKGRVDIIEDELSEIVPSQLKIVIPDEVNAIVGTELNLWNDAISLSIDRGLASPTNYAVLWQCNKGLVTDRCFRFTPSASDVGQVRCTCTIYSTSTRKSIATKTFTINVYPKDAVENSANIVLLSHSFGMSIAKQLFANLHDISRYTGTIPTMFGTRSTVVGSDTIHYEARGGYTWRHYATANAIFAYRMNVSGITSAGIGSKYSITIGSATTEVTILENNTDSGDGNLLVEAAYGAKIQNFPATGTLTLVSGAGDDSISFTEGTEETGNPFWDTENEQVSLSVYKQNVGLRATDKIDAFICCLGCNETNTPTDTTKQYIETMYNAFVADNPDCKMVLDVHASAGNDVNGEGFNYGASHDHLKYLEGIYKYRLLCLEMVKSGDYPNIVLSSAGLEVDRFYGYALEDRVISARVSQAEKVHNNYVHPTTSGYQQVADTYIADISKALSV